MASELKDLSKLCIHTITTKPWRLDEAIDAYRKAGVAGITVWREAIEPFGARQAGAMLRDSGLEVVSLCRGGFFAANEAGDRQKALDDNRRAIDEAAEVGAPMVVLVCGAVPGMELEDGRGQIAEGIAAVASHARQAGVKLAIEPLHPMYADCRSAINTLRQANDMVEALKDDHVGVAVDVYHLWWDDQLEHEIARCGRLGALLAFHVCDWRTPTRDLLTDRGLMGEGCIPIRKIRAWVEAAGFNGMNEVEIFSTEFWDMDQQAYLEKIIRAYQESV